VGDPILESNTTRRVDFALFMVKAIENDALVYEAPAIVGCQPPSALGVPPPPPSLDLRDGEPCSPGQIVTSQGCRAPELRATRGRRAAR
jgi:hypothetical protein